VALRFTLRQLEYLVAVGQAGSITLAAEGLNVSAPSISTAIAQLEAEFGLPLFVRKHAHGMSPTQSGREIIREAAAALAAAGRLIELAAQYRGTVKGRLNIGCLLTFAQILVPQLRRSFIDRYPEVEFHQSETHQAALIDGLRDATLDVALTYDLALPADLEFIELASLPPFIMLPAAHPLSHHPSVTLADLTDWPLVLLDLPLSADYFLSFFEKASLKPRIADRSRDMAVVQSLVANNFGYSIANVRPLTNRAPDGKALVFVPLAGAVQPMRMGLLCAGGSRASLTIRAFIDHATETLQTLLPDLTLRV
jgi:DNA-binding transcriptional LysR family regulator